MLLSVGGLSFVLLSLQLVLMRMLSYSHGYHLATVVISMALLGIGAGGSVLAVWRWCYPRSRCRQSTPDGFSMALLLCGVSTAWLAIPLRPLLAGIEVDLLHVEPRQWARLGATGGLLLLPFFFGALALAVAFADRAEAIGKLYAANLAGSAAGALAAPVALRFLLPEHGLPLLGLVAVLGAIPVHSARRFLVVALGALALAAVLPVELPRSPYKAISHALRFPDADYAGPFPDPRGRLERVRAPALRYAPDLSLHYTGVTPSPTHLFVDGEAAGVMLCMASPGAMILAETPRGLPFAVAPARRVLMLAPGGTAMVNPALAAGALVTVVEPHSRLAEHMRSCLPPEVLVDTANPRLFLSRHAARSPPDLIIFPDRGQFGGPTGLQALGEDYLFTVEAVRTAFDRLASGGALALSAWLDEPLRHAPRLLDLVAEALRHYGVKDPRAHLLVVRGWGSLTILAGREPLAIEQIEAAMAFTRAKGFDLIWPPQPGQPRLHAGGSHDLDGMLAGLLGPARASFHARTRFDLRAPVDRRPFFNQFLRMGDRASDLDQLSISERGLVVLRFLVILMGGAAGVLVLGPLWTLGAKRRGRSFTLFYFGGLGAGFMMVEVALIQRFMLLLGDPVYAVAVVIAALLAGMCAGSTISRRYDPQPRLMALMALVAAVFQAVVLLGLDRGSEILAGLHGAVRFTLVPLLAGLPAVVMGMLFPLGIRLLFERDPRHIPWACGIDGALGVLSVPLAGWIAVMYGFQILPVVAAACYVLAAFAAQLGWSWNVK